MARANLRGLIGNLPDAETAKPEVAALPAPVAKHSEATTAATEGGDPRARLESEPPAAPVVRPRSRARGTGADVHFTSFERKETRLRADQLNALTEHARRLSKAKGVGGQRITDNTLIRVAIDLLLSRIDTMSGQNEAELRRSVGLPGGKR